ncbi:MAG: PTS sugar transporter subunit IIA [Gemmatimonadetes bacterium]|nr:PTS sugar transporter subunit IIA [Gemmatimonadota bacterium]MBT8405415.1 PTS sugar transporter subunit IIA [Gemmatimonadota bacterium]NNF39004.1 PTS sugar transporter subunit IIA [Gemmatimonadota bacterium]NNK62349.1 PTS sugar transporter subunit IIA [Gemmatimonadota bacterium]
MRLNEYLRADLVLTGLDAGDRNGVIDALAEHLTGSGVVADARGAARALLKREQAFTTAMGHGMALPHATLPGLERAVLMVALAARPIQFGPDETDPVRIFFVLLSPPGREGEHIKLLARICRLVRHPGFVDELSAAGDGVEVVRVIRRVDEQHV